MSRDALLPLCVVVFPAPRGGLAYVNMVGYRTSHLDVLLAVAFPLTIMNTITKLWLLTQFPTFLCFGLLGPRLGSVEH